MALRRSSVQSIILSHGIYNTSYLLETRKSTLRYPRSRPRNTELFLQGARALNSIIYIFNSPLPYMKRNKLNKYMRKVPLYTKFHSQMMIYLLLTYSAPNHSQDTHPCPILAELLQSPHIKLQQHHHRSNQSNEAKHTSARLRRSTVESLNTLHCTSSTRRTRGRGTRWARSIPTGWEWRGRRGCLSGLVGEFGYGDDRHGLDGDEVDG